jgi:hypothetical protein
LYMAIRAASGRAGISPMSIVFESRLSMGFNAHVSLKGSLFIIGN